MTRVALVIPAASYRAGPFVAAAARLDVELVLLTDAEVVLGADSAVVVEDLADPAVVRAAAGRLGVLDAVLGVDDAAVIAAAVVARHHGLAHHSYSATVAALDKAAQRAAFAVAAVAQPEHRSSYPNDDAAEIAAAVGFPCVIKPTSLSGGRGVIRVESPSEARWAAARVRDILALAGQDPTHALLVEAYVAGPEVAVEGVLSAGRLHVLAVFDKPGQAEGPFFPETMLVTPSRLGPAQASAVRATTAQAAAALGLSDGPLHAELRVGRDGPVVLELHARSIGGLCSRTLQFGLDRSLEEVLLRCALGWPTDLERNTAATGVSMIDVPRAGTFRGLGGLRAARQVAGIEDIVVTAAPSSVVRPLPDASDYLAFVFAAAAEPADVEAALTEAVARLEVRIEPVQRLAGG